MVDIAVVDIAELPVLSILFYLFYLSSSKCLFVLQMFPF